MRPTSLLRLGSYSPRIQFMGSKWKEPKKPHAPAPHPMAPPEIAKDFQSFLAKLQSTSTSASNPSSNPKTQTPADSAKGKVDRTTESSAKTDDVWKGKPAPPVDFENFWEAPESLWKPKEWSEREIEAVMAHRQGLVETITCMQTITMSCWAVASREKAKLLSQEAAWDNRQLRLEAHFT